MIAAESASETSVNFYETTRCSIPEDSQLYTRRLQNLKSDNGIFGKVFLIIDDTLGRCAV
jgi:hypothetical protein